MTAQQIINNTSQRTKDTRMLIVESIEACKNNRKFLLSVFIAGGVLISATLFFIEEMPVWVKISAPVFFTLLAFAYQRESNKTIKIMESDLAEYDAETGKINKEYDALLREMGRNN